MEIADTANLTDADWAEINKLKAAYEKDGQRGLSNALGKLADDPIRYLCVIGAFFPDMVRDAIKDDMAAQGVTEEDIRELVRRLESGTDKLQ